MRSETDEGIGVVLGLRVGSCRNEFGAGPAGKLTLAAGSRWLAMVQEHPSGDDFQAELIGFSRGMAIRSERH